MSEINLYLLDMTNEANTSGVDRHVNSLLNGFENYPYIRVYRIQFIRGNVLFYKEEKKGNYTQVTIPMPQQSNEIIEERYWFGKYNEQVFSLVHHLFEDKPNRIIHIHTLNLIALASYINNQLPCRIITHLHCIPWKGLYDKNQKIFNQLYASYYFDNNQFIDKEQFFTNNCESDSYNKPDKIICVTRCAKEFLVKTMDIPDEKISVVTNGINYLWSDDKLKKFEDHSGAFQCLFVGVLSEGKGVFFILKALRKVQAKGYNVCLNMAGMCPLNIRKQIMEEYRDLHVNVLGRIPFEELQQYYRNSDFGIIASLQEQCSYAAIEMAMFGLPIVTTAVDGLDEMFTDEVNALKVNTKFSKVFGLSVDTDMLAEKIITLIENNDLRTQLGVNARRLYQTLFNLENMMEETVAVYKKMIENKQYE